ncbi:methyl-accepting chemotaxis protein [Sporolactobacillus nakayamae]|uniref:Methyl-accepting chemotaxis sensory transducer with Cache sensor n=1 Tax=Sporolactobacillus nakayamae TaxID=269670 RepID=A0A1I2U658_9BACL|nr:methyl-accepting chemotaxis protein [Sporolactobacillus nakayamae]SFG72614.1 methyl-accepting chemotaxis sensory transducer with Cache sensor [Sporolactobacillus nakayamae]
MKKEESNAKKVNKPKNAAEEHSKNSGRLTGGKINSMGKFIRKLPQNVSGRGLSTMSLRKQLLIPIVSIIAIVGIIGGLFSYLYGARQTTDQLTQSTMAQLKATNQTFDTYFDDAQSVARQFTMSKTLGNVQKNKDEIQLSFQNVLSSNTKYQAISYASADKDIVRAPLYFFPRGYDPTTEGWYKAGTAANGKSVWTDPYNDKVTKQNVVSVAQAVVDEGKVKGVVKMDLFIQSIINQVSAAKLGETGYATLLDSKGTYIASPKKSQLGKSVSGQEFYKKMRGMGNSGNFYAKIDGSQKLVSFFKNKTSGWTLMGIIDKSEISKQANLITLPSVVTLIIIIAVAILLTSYILGRMIARLRKLQEAAGRIEKGDLTVKIPAEGNDELSQLTKSVNQMAQTNREAFKKMIDVSHQIIGASQTLVASAEENVASANEISATVTEIAAGASNQSKSIDDSQTSLQDLLKQVNRIDDRSKEVLNGAYRMTEFARGGLDKMDHLSVQSKTSADTTHRIISTVLKLEEHAKRVHKIIDVLDGIARRTNLLSLNASIEAAHAGEQGKGFAVVAGEIRKLAQQTNQSLKEVTDMVQSMNEEIQQAVAYCEQTNDTLKGQDAAVAESNDAFKEIQKTIERNVTGMKTIADAIINTNQQIEQITQGAQTIAATSEETAASTEEMSASVQEQTASMDELNKLAGDLDQQAQMMQEEIKRFKI